MAQKTGYTKPRLFDYGGDVSKEWYVGFRHTCPYTHKRKPFQIRGGMNYATTVGQRNAEGKALAGLLERFLADGWNPHLDDFRTYVIRTKAPEYEMGRMAFNDALDYILGKKRMAKKSVSCYEGVVRFAKTAALRTALATMPVMHMKRADAKRLLDQIGADRQAAYDKVKKGRLKGQQWTGNSYNKYKGYLQGLFSDLLEYDAVEYNPFDKIKDQPKIRTNVHRHATEAEVALIKAHLKGLLPEFFRFLNCEYQTGIRPNELLGLRVRDYDVLNQAFNVLPIEGGSKTRIARLVPIPDAFLKYLMALELHKHRPDDYIFSAGFVPGTRRLKRDTATKLWQEEVKVKLGINVSLYSFKGLGGDDKREAGVDATAVQSLFGHTKMSTTRIYLHREQDRINQQIRERTRDL